MKWYDTGDYPLRTVIVWPIPTQPNMVVAWLWQPLIDAKDLDTDMVFPKGYERALRYSLAIELAPEFGKSVDPNVTKIAGAAKSVVRRLNSVPQILRGDIELANKKAGIFNWITGDTVNNRI